VIREKVEQEAVLAERNRIAGEVHDGMAQAIAAILFHMEAIRVAIPATAHSALTGLATTRAVVLEALADASRSIREVRLPTKPVGLETALREMLERFGAGAPIELQVEDGGPSLDADTEYHIMRVAQEAVANAVRHAEGSRVRVEVTFPGEKILLRIVDEGPGFDTAFLEEKMTNSPGLAGMRRRASSLKGELVVRSAPGRGTEVSLEVPPAMR
jgi:signal transduction histidine kinase